MAEIILTERRLKRFWLKATLDEATGCLLWTAGKYRRGYGQFVGHPAHRVAWTIVNGPIPPGLCVCHKCDTPPCINTDHLFLGTSAENTHDRDRKGRGHWAKLNITHCPYGHPYSGRNVVLGGKSWGRRCRACAVETTKLWRAKNPDKTREYHRLAKERKASK